MLKNILLILLLSLLSACATGERIVRLEPGMSKDQVVGVMGRPDGFKVEGEYEVLRYTNKLISGWSYDRADYSIILKSNKLVEYGAGKVRTKQAGPNMILFLAP